MWLLNYSEASVSAEGGERMEVGSVIGTWGTLCGGGKEVI